ncbi:MAG: CheY-like chemotaxis protein [Polaribacter sp.]|jgi:CheY-like chemotaxis protein
MISKQRMISIIDDDKIYQFMLTRIINDNKLADRIISFSDGEEAIHYLNEHCANAENIPNIIFLDVNMPIMDGWQFMKEYANIKVKIKKKIVIFMLSSSINPIDIQRAQQISEISDYIVKPIKLEEVKRVLDNLEFFS